MSKKPVLISADTPCKWRDRFLKLAEHVAQWSRDPSTKVGAVIVRPNKSIASLGFNGFPQGIDDANERYEDRSIKYDLIVHGEINAISFAQESLVGYTLYTWPFLPCCRCAGIIIQNGINAVIAPVLPDELKERWEGALATTKQMFDEANVAWQEIPIKTK